MLSFGESETTVLVDFPDIPVIQADEQVMAAVIEESDYVWSTAFSGTRFEGYVPETIVADSATMLAQDLMGKPNVYGENHKLQSKGCGIMAIDRNRADDAPALEDYKILNFKMVNFFNGLRALNDRYHTIATAHAHIDETEEDSKKTLRDKSRIPGTYIGLPVLPGKLQYHADNMSDFFVYCENKWRGNKYSWFAHLVPYGMWHARTKIYKHVEHSIEDPTFDKIYQCYLNAFKENK